jgi:hypothetical protein
VSFKVQGLRMVMAAAGRAGAKLAAAVMKMRVQMVMASTCRLM